MSRDWQRASTTKQIEERKRAILDAARELFLNHNYDNISLNSIAREAHFSKSNIYRYFKNKEEIFLVIYLELLAELFCNLSLNIKKLPVECDIEVFIDNFVNTIEQHSHCLDLSLILNTSLEANSSYDQVKEFKINFLSLYDSFIESVHHIYPNISKEYLAKEFIFESFIVVKSVWSSSKKNPVLEKIYQEKEFSYLKVNFKEQVSRIMIKLFSFYKK